MLQPIRFFFFLGGIIILALPLIAQDPAIDQLATQLRTGQLPIRREAAKALGRVSLVQSVQLLQQALSIETNASVRLEIIRALRTIIFQRYPGYRQALQAISNATKPNLEPDELIRLRATQALWEAGKKDLLDPVTILQRSLSDPSQSLRLAAVMMLRKLGTPATIDVLAAAASDKNQHQTIRLKAIEALGAVSLSDQGPVGREIAAANIAIFSHRGVQPAVRLQTLDRLHERQIGHLSTIATDPSNGATLILRAVKSIGQIKDKSAIPILERIIATQTHPAIIKHATRVLSHVMARQYE